MTRTTIDLIRRFGQALIPVMVLALGACEPGGASGNDRDDSCDDGTQPMCAMVPPTCDTDEILAYQDDCYACVSPLTCEPWDPSGSCTGDADCAEGQWCNPCGSSSCPGCTDCVASCSEHDCPSEQSTAMCEMVRPECGDYGVAVVVDDCWQCVSVSTCEPVRDEVCDDGTTPTCDMIPPQCDGSEVLAHQNDCYICVNPATCLPWGTAGCGGDEECDASEWCNPCASPSCPDCADCVSACQPHGCPTETELLCFCARPDCGPYGAAIIQDGCYVCVDMDTCGPPVRDTQCDDGSEPTCANMMDCLEAETLALQQGVYVCVNTDTCLPWGQAGCAADADCMAEDHCDPCGTSSCADCDDCLAACQPHGCPTEANATCNMVRPDCAQDEVAVVQNSCWECVNLLTCQ